MTEQKGRWHMPQTDYSEISPVDLRNPFRNPTEEPDYSPDYREIAPELSMAGSRLPLYPEKPERSRIRRFFNLTFLTLIFGLIVTLSIYTGLRMLSALILKQIDLRKLGNLPPNYMMIAEQYMNDSAIGNAINLISFLCGNLIAFWVGCRLTNVKAETMFRLRDLGAVRTVKYVLVGLWLQLLTGLLAGWLLPFLRRAGIPVTGHPVSLEGSRSKIMLLVLYCCLIAPVTEELLMRGIVLKNLSRVSQRFGIFMSAFLFAVMHDNLPQFLLTFPLGILLGYITIQHNSLTPAIITHMAVNSFAMLQQFAHRMLERSLFRTAELSYILLLLLLGSAAFFYMLLTERLPDKTPHQSSRGMRLAAGCPLFWAFLCLHAAIVIYAMI